MNVTVEEINGPLDSRSFVAPAVVVGLDEEITKCIVRQLQMTTDELFYAKIRTSIKQLLTSRPEEVLNDRVASDPLMPF